MHWAWAVGMQSKTEGLLELEESDIEVLDDIWKGTNSIHKFRYKDKLCLLPSRKNGAR